MRKFPSVIFLLSFFLYACSPSTATTPSVNVTPSPSINIIIPTPPSCTTIVTAPTPGPDVPSVFPPITNKDRVRGAQHPIVTVMYYGDYQDSRSALFYAATNQLIEEHPDDVQVVTRAFPLKAINDKAALAAQAVEAASEQGKFWELHDLLYKQQANWVSLSAEDFEQWIGAQASALELDVEQFKADMKREDIVSRVEQAWNDGQKMGLPGTPLVLVNGQIYGGPRDFNSLNDIVQLILLGRRQFASCPPVTVQQNKQYIATLHTEKGEVKIQLYADKAPITVNSFIYLVKNGWYDDITFHRVIPNHFAQTGDPSGTGKGNPGYYIITEFDPSLTFYKPGMVGMVNSGPDTSGSQFFITYAPIADFNGKYTIFGEVISGMDVIDQLTPRDAQPGESTPPGDKLISITIDER